MDHDDCIELPILPLTSSVVPGMLVPLRLFEPRYRQLGAHLTAEPGSGRFATVMIERGSEVGGGDQRSNIGCLLEVKSYRRADDGSWSMLTSAVERIRVMAWMDDSPWPRGLVQSWPDGNGDIPSAGELSRLVTDLAALAIVGRANGLDSSCLPLLSLGPSSICWYAAAALPIGDSDRQRLLDAPTLKHRFQLLRFMLDDQHELMRLLEQHGGEPSG